MRKGILVAGAVVAVAAGAAAAALIAWPEPKLEASGDALARVSLPHLAGRLQAVRVTDAGGTTVPVRVDHGDLLPAVELPQGAVLHVAVTVRRPGFAAWLVGRTVTRRFAVTTPSVRVARRMLRIPAGAPVTIPLDGEAAVVSVDGRRLEESTPAAAVRTGLAASGPNSAGTVVVAAAARTWERLGAPVRVSWFPPAAHDRVVAAPAPGTALAPDATLTLAFSAPIAAAFAADPPRLAPAVPGRWRMLDAHTISFEPAGLGFPLGGTLRVRLPKPLRATLAWHVQPGATLRLQQLLARLGYLPLRWTPAAAPPATAAQEIAGAVSPPAGTFAWRYATAPAGLRALWQPGRTGTLTRGATMRFEDAHGLRADGIAGAAVWRDLLADALAGKRNASGYTYVLVHEQTTPELLSVWHDGRIVVRSPGNTGISQAPTTQGTYPVFEHIPEGTMSGTDPSGKHYHDTGIRWISYFHGGDAIHAFDRASYGTPQSLGCVELPLSAAARVWPYTPIGTLVTIEP